MSQPPRQRPPANSPPTRTSGPPPRRGGYNERPRAVQSQRDPFPYIMGGIIGAMIIGLGAVIFLILSNNNTTSVTNNNGTPAPTTAANTPPRMPIGDFKALYDAPAKRPLIVDVRPVASYAEGHILGAVSMPETDIDKLVADNQVPKDKIIVAYCQ